MGLMAARIAETMGSTGARFAIATSMGAGVSTGMVLSGQYAYSEDFSTPQTKPGPMNHAIGLGVGAAGALTSGIAAYHWSGGEFNSLNTVVGRKVTLAAGGLAVGALVGSYLIAPTIRRMGADGAAG
jgi:hypothetical protein